MVRSAPRADAIGKGRRTSCCGVHRPGAARHGAGRGGRERRCATAGGRIGTSVGRPRALRARERAPGGTRSGGGARGQEDGRRATARLGTAAAHDREASGRALDAPSRRARPAAVRAAGRRPTRGLARLTIARGGHDRSRESRDCRARAEPDPGALARHEGGARAPRRAARRSRTRARDADRRGGGPRRRARGPRGRARPPTSRPSGAGRACPAARSARSRRRRAPRSSTPRRCSRPQQSPSRLSSRTRPQRSTRCWRPTAR